MLYFNFNRGPSGAVEYLYAPTNSGMTPSEIDVYMDSLNKTDSAYQRISEMRNNVLNIYIY